MEKHEQAVARIASAVADYHDRGEPYRVFHGSTNTTRPRPDPSSPLIDISALSNVLHIDRDAQTALVEPNVPMDRLVEAALAHGLIPPVVMEFPGITAGGGFAGTSGESSSFRYGFFDSIVEEVEMVLASGEVVVASRDNERADLFRGAAGAMGSLGLTTLLRIKLMPARKFVALTYHRTSSTGETVARIQAETENAQNDYIDGILYSKDHGVVMTGRLTDEKPTDRPVQTFSDARDPWFFQHAQEQAGTDYIPLAEYLFRYDRAAFWTGLRGMEYFKFVPANSFTRRLFDDFLHTRVLYRSLHAGGFSASLVTQDLALPYDTAEQFVEYAADEFAIWPLWLCPLAPAAMPTFHPVTTAAAPGAVEHDTSGAVMSRPMLNVGLWGWGPKKHDEFVKKNRSLEDKVAELGGRKWLYAHTYYTEDEFRKIYDAPGNGNGDGSGDGNDDGEPSWYDSLRAKYHASTLPSAWQKVHIRTGPEAQDQQPAAWKSVWPLGGLWGMLAGVASGDRKLHRRAEWKWQGGRQSQ